MSSLLQLLTIICDGSSDDFEAFRAANKSLLNTYKLDEDLIAHNLKLLALCSLAAESGAGSKEVSVVSFQAIQKLLKVDENEVELWVIEAIADNLIEASIDQLNGVVNIRSQSHLN